MNKELNSKIINLRKEGKTFSEIQKLLDVTVSKSSLSYICKNIKLNTNQKNRINNQIKNNLIIAREKSVVSAIIRKKTREERLLQKNLYLGKIIQRADGAKLALVTLFLGEGSKTHTATVVFGNSNPYIISLFLKLFRKCYMIEESKFRCTVQCRADQNIEELRNFWTQITKIPLTQFYKTQVDPRTKGKISKKTEYKGVCRIDYLSTEVVCDLHQSIRAIGIMGL